MTTQMSSSDYVPPKVLISYSWTSAPIWQCTALVHTRGKYISLVTPWLGGGFAVSAAAHWLISLIASHSPPYPSIYLMPIEPLLVISTDLSKTGMYRYIKQTKVEPR